MRFVGDEGEVNVPTKIQGCVKRIFPRLAHLLFARMDYTTYVFACVELCNTKVAPWCRYNLAMSIVALYSTATITPRQLQHVPVTNRAWNVLSANQSACPKVFVTFSLPEHDTELYSPTTNSAPACLAAAMWGFH